MTRRYYSSTATQTTLDAGVSAGATSMTVVSVSGFPGSFPYTLIIDPDGTEEVVTVTAGGGVTLTVTRGEDGTSAVAHDAGVTVQHGVSARDFDEPNDHVNSSTGVHSVTGAVVGTTDTQTLSGKTLTEPTIASFVNAEHTHAAAGATGGTVSHGDLTDLTTGDDHTQYQLESEKSAANGYASLGADGLIPEAELGLGLITTVEQVGTVVVDGTTQTIVESGDFALAAGRAYEITLMVRTFDPTSDLGHVSQFIFQDSVNSGGAWGSNEALGSFYAGNAASGYITVSPCYTHAFIPSTARATYRVRCTVTRYAGTAEVDLSGAYLYVKCIGHDLS